MIKQTFFCDSCIKEFNPKEGITNLQSVLVKMNEKLEKQVLTAEGNYCAGCSELLLNFIATLKKELKK